MEEAPEGTKTEDDVPVEGEENVVGDEAAAHEEVGGEGLEEAEGEHLEGEHVDGEQVENEKDKEKLVGEGEEVMGEGVEEEQEPVKQTEEEKPPEQVEEEEGYVEEPPPDPAAPFDLSDSKEALKEPFQLRPDQLAEVEQLWELYQNYTPAYTDIKGHITEKELIYMLKCLLLMTHTPEQLQELIAYCVRPPHPEGHISFEQFVKIVTLRQREFNVEDELRAALRVLDPDMTGAVDREYLREVLSKQGHKLTQKLLDNLIKEVDMSNDGTIGIDDVVGTMGIDLNKEDLVMLMAAVYPDGKPPGDEDE